MESWTEKYACEMCLKVTIDVLYIRYDMRNIIFAENRLNDLLTQIMYKKKERILMSLEELSKIRCRIIFVKYNSFFHHYSVIKETSREKG